MSDTIPSCSLLLYKTRNYIQSSLNCRSKIQSLIRHLMLASSFAVTALLPQICCLSVGKMEK